MSKISKMVIAANSLAGMVRSYSSLTIDTPKGLFGRRVLVTTKDLLIDGSKLDVEFTVPFDDDTEANEAEIIVYNLSPTSLSFLKYDTPITITAGYADDTGIIFSGFISKVATKSDGNDMKTTITAIDSMQLQARKIDSIAYGAGVAASYILKDLVQRTGLPLAVFKPKRDYTYESAVTVSGELMDNIKKYAEVCGISVYVLKGKAYARHITDGDDIEFTVSPGTGLLGSPEEFEQEITAEDFKDIVKGQKIKMLLQHRITTAAVINLQAKEVQGKFRVRNGRHVCGGSDFYTEMEAIQ